MNLTLRYMTVEDIPAVIDIDGLSFPNAWSETTYRFEITENPTAHMVVLTEAEGDGPPRIVGYAGMWYIAGEAHISTIAVHPNWRGRGYGEVILAGLLRRALVLGAECAVLEVRVSNVPALGLYRKYEFQSVGVRRNYYRDNGEDAYTMSLSPIDEAYALRFAGRLGQLRARLPFTDLLGSEG